MRNPCSICGIVLCLALTIAFRQAPAQVAPPPEDVPAPKRELPSTRIRAALGIRATEVTESAIREFGLTVRQGALISALLRASPAEQAGLPLGGVIVAVDGERIDTPEDLVRVIRSNRPGQRVELKYYDGERLFRKSINLAPYAVGPPPGGGPSPGPWAPRSPVAPADLPPVPRSRSLAELATTVADLETQVDRLRREVAQLKRIIEEFIEKP
ncbi:MAG: S1C family serine protease [Pirellulaceae bacterium]